MLFCVLVKDFIFVPLKVTENLIVRQHTYNQMNCGQSLPVTHWDYKNERLVGQVEHSPSKHR